jgi:hypothetical protein
MPQGRRRKSLKHINVEQPIPISPMASEVEVFGDGEWPAEGVVDEHRMFFGRTL